MLWALIFMWLAVEPSPAEEASYKFDLVDSAGEVTTEQAWSGRYLLVTFGFTSCPDICPLTLWNMGSALRALGATSQDIKPVFISVDPLRDTRDDLKAYAEHFHPDFVALTGSRAQLDQASRNFNASYGYKVNGQLIDFPTSEEMEYEVFHSIYVYLLSPERELLDVFGYGVDGERMAERILELLRLK